jgi:hypothetical protein
MSTVALDDAITSALQQWNQGQQQAALDVLRPHAEAGDRAALLLICWFMSQMGQPYYNEGLGYARKAHELGTAQGLIYFFANIANDQTMRPQAIEVARLAVAAGANLDPLPNALPAMQQNDPTTAVALVKAAAEPRPSEEALTAMIRQGEADLSTLNNAATEVADRRDVTINSFDSDSAALHMQREEIERRAQSLIDLIDNLTNAQATSYFEEEATGYGKEARFTWRGGLGVLGLAALVALLPILAYYFDRITGRDPWLEGHDLVAAHFTPALALGAVAGVLLARARNRDRARQRARDLSVVLQTMFVYAEGLGTVEERQQFIREMGRSVLAAFLQQEIPSESDHSVVGAVTRS